MEDHYSSNVADRRYRIINEELYKIAERLSTAATSKVYSTCNSKTNIMMMRFYSTSNKSAGKTETVTELGKNKFS